MLHANAEGTKLIVDISYKNCIIALFTLLQLMVAMAVVIEVVGVAAPL